jgi:hypothetical protein
MPSSRYSLDEDSTSDCCDYSCSLFTEWTELLSSLPEKIYDWFDDIYYEFYEDSFETSASEKFYFF